MLKLIDIRSVKVIAYLFIIYLCVNTKESLSANIAHTDDMNCAIRISGNITHGDLQKIQHAINGRKGISVCLDSFGGSWQESQKIAEFFLENQIGTFVGKKKKCYSACSIIFMSGNKVEKCISDDPYEIDDGWRHNPITSISCKKPNRRMHVLAKVGFHAPYIQLPDRKYNAKFLSSARRAAMKGFAKFFELAFRYPEIIPKRFMGMAIKQKKDQFFEIDTIDKAGWARVELVGYIKKKDYNLIDLFFAVYNKEIWSRDMSVSEFKKEFKYKYHLPSPYGLNPLFGVFGCMEMGLCGEGGGDIYMERTCVAEQCYIFSLIDTFDYQYDYKANKLIELNRKKDIASAIGITGRLLKYKIFGEFIPDWYAYPYDKKISSLYPENQHKQNSRNKPEESEYYLSKAQNMINSNDYEGGILFYTRALESSPDLAEAYLGRGVAWRHKSICSKAIKDFDRYIEIKDRDFRGWFERALCYAKLNKFDMAIHDLNKAIYLNNKYVQSFYLRGIIWKRKGRCDRAVQDFSNYIALKPDNPKAWFQRASCFEKLHNYKMAINDYSEAIKLDRKNEHILLIYRGNAWRRKGKQQPYLALAKTEFENAIADFDRSITLKPSYVHSYIAKGDAFIDMFDYKKAVNSYRSALRINPKMYRLYFYIGNALRKQGEAKYDEAIENYTKCISLKKNFIFAYYMRGITWEEKGKYKRAELDYTLAIDYNPSYSAAYAVRGRVREKMGALEKAWSDYRKALSLPIKFNNDKWAHEFAKYRLRALYKNRQ